MTNGTVRDHTICRHASRSLSSSYCLRLHHKGGTESNGKRGSQRSHYLPTCIKKPIQVLSTYCLRVQHKGDPESNDKPCSHWPLYLDHISPTPHALIIDAVRVFHTTWVCKISTWSFQTPMFVWLLGYWGILTHHVNNNTVHNLKQEPNCRRKLAWNVENNIRMHVFWSACRSVQHCFMMKCCLMSSDVSWHIRDKLWPMPKHGAIIIYVHGNQKARQDGQPRTATSTLTQLLNYALLYIHRDRKDY